MKIEYVREAAAFAVRTVVCLSLITPVVAFASTQSQLPANAVLNSQHYRDSGIGNAQGRAGAAMMTARALLAKDNSSLIEVTTGVLDSGLTPPGNFSKVQYKPMDGNGNFLFAQNFTANTVSGYYSFTSPSLYRGEQIQLQGNITNIDRNRTDVVTVVETVKLRPDLVVQNLQPGSAVLNEPVNISANIIEQNGDTGATADCQLYVDGSLADTTKGIWVDAAGSVTCAFKYSFTTTGNHSVQITAANVVPADWDTSNNSASGSINVTSPDQLQHGQAYFESWNGEFPLQETEGEEVWYNGSPVYNYSNTWSNVGVQQSSWYVLQNFSCDASVPAFQFPVSVTVKETMDGAPVYSYTNNVTSGKSQTSNINFPMCGVPVTTVTGEYGVDYFNDHNQYVWSWRYLDSNGNIVWSGQEVWSQRWAGDVTYFSQGYECYWWSDCSDPNNYYSWNSPGSNVYGTVIPVGSTWAVTASAQDSSGNTVSGSMSVPLSTQNINVDQPTQTYNYGPDAGGYTYQYTCGANYNYNYTSGFAQK